MRMKPILIFLALIAGVVMAFTFSLGLRYHYGRAVLEERMLKGEVITEAERNAVGNIFPRHFVWGMLTGIIVSGVHTLVLTYFLGTGKAIKEQMELQQWGSEEYDRWKKLMARSVAPSSLGIILIVIAAFSGGFTMITKLPPTGHLIIATICVLGQVPIIMWEIAIIRENGKIMDRIVNKLGEDVKLTI